MATPEETKPTVDNAVSAPSTPATISTSGASEGASAGALRKPKRLEPAPAPTAPGEDEKVVTDPNNMYVFVGDESQVGTTRLSGYGTQIKITDFQTLEDVICGGVALVPKSKWDEAGFTDEELEKYNSVATHNPDDADMGFLRKVVMMRVAASKFAQPIIKAQAWRAHQDNVKRSEEAGIARRERHAQMIRLLQEMNPDYQPPIMPGLTPDDMLVKPKPVVNNVGEIIATSGGTPGFEMDSTIEVIKGKEGVSK